MTEQQELMIADLVLAAKTYDAIKKCSEFSGLPMNEARLLVAKIEEQYKNPFAVQPPLANNVVLRVKEILAKGDHHKIEAIKVCRELAMIGLKDAKESVEDIIYKRKEWPKLSYFNYHEIKDGNDIGKGVQILMDLGMTAKEARIVAASVLNGNYREPEAPPCRTIDDVWGS